MPIINSRSNAKFDALVRTNKDDSLIAFIMASHNVKESDNRKELVAEKLKTTYELFKEKGSGTYGDGSRDLKDQFESHYTMGYEMGIWIDSDLNLSSLAKKVAVYDMTIKEYIGTVFRNLFTFYEINGETQYHHFLYEVLNYIKNKGLAFNELPKDLIKETLPLENRLQNEQGNLLFNYLMATDIFTKLSNDKFKLNDEWQQDINKLISTCNLEYENKPKEDAMEMAKDKQRYSDYVSQMKSFDLPISESTERRVIGGENILFYGVPGSGKSHTIESEYGKENMIRVVFHPDYMNTDFIGQILPTVKEDKTITYEFTPGPFTKIMREAYKHPNNQYYLVIEEINRGNAPAIFGEIFQLLDRDEDGQSKYAVVNYSVAREMYEDESIPVKIPSNLSVLATMNTSDQNVFALDTAFQRRWNMRMIMNDISQAKHKDVEIADTSVTWGVFNTVINNQILTSNSAMLSSEDKRLGSYFISPTDLEGQDIEKRFSEKVIKYLWDDAFKFSRDKLFNTSILRSLEDVIIEFVKNKGNERFSIFKEEIREYLFEQSKITVDTSSSENADEENHDEK